MATAAIYYLPEGFDTTGSRLMGRHAAGEGFLKGMVQHATQPLYCFTKNQATMQDFQKRVAGFGGAPENTHFIPFAQPVMLEKPGAVFLPGPGIDTNAWLRRRMGQRRYSLTGVTHTTASDSIMQIMANLLTAPVQSWDAVICTSTVVRQTFEYAFQANAEYLGQRLGAKVPLPAVQLPVIPLGVECAAFAPTERTSAQRSEWRNTLGIGEDDIAVLFMGRLSFHAKAHPYPMYAALQKAAERTGKRVHLIQAGWFANDSIEKAFRQGATDICPSVTCHFLDGRKPQTRQQIWFAADIFCSLSDNIQETFGLTPIEAMAAGLPLVVSDWNGYKDTVRDGVDGIRVPTLAPQPGMGEDLAYRYEAEIDNYDLYCGNACLAVSVDIAAAAEAFVTLIQDPEKRKRMGHSARARAEAVYDWRHVVAAYEALWTELAARRATDAEIAASVPGSPMNPLRDDPFRLFATYPTEAIHPDQPVRVLCENLQAAFAQVRAMPLNRFGNPAPDELILKTVNFLTAHPSTTVHDIIQAVAPNDARAMRVLLLLAKFGLVSVGGHNGGLA